MLIEIPVERNKTEVLNVSKSSKFYLKIWLERFLKKRGEHNFASRICRYDKVRE